MSFVLYYVGYHGYPPKYIVNANMVILTIQHMATSKLNITTANNCLLQFQLAYICYSCLLIHEQVRHSVWDHCKDRFPSKTMSVVEKCRKGSMPRTLSMIILYVKGEMLKYRVLSSFTFVPHFLISY